MWVSISSLFQHQLPGNEWAGVGGVLQCGCNSKFPNLSVFFEKLYCLRGWLFLLMISEKFSKAFRWYRNRNQRIPLGCVSQLKWSTGMPHSFKLSCCFTNIMIVLWRNSDFKWMGPHSSPLYGLWKCSRLLTKSSCKLLIFFLILIVSLWQKYYLRWVYLTMMWQRKMKLKAFTVEYLKS